MRPYERLNVITKLYIPMWAAFVGYWSILLAEVLQGHEHMFLKAHVLTVALKMSYLDYVNYFSCADHADRLACTSLISHITNLDHAGVKCLAYCRWST